MTGITILVHPQDLRVPIFSALEYNLPCYLTSFRALCFPTLLEGLRLLLLCLWMPVFLLQLELDTGTSPFSLKSAHAHFFSLLSFLAREVLECHVTHQSLRSVGGVAIEVVNVHFWIILCTHSPGCWSFANILNFRNNLFWLLHHNLKWGTVLL